MILQVAAQQSARPISNSALQSEIKYRPLTVLPTLSLGAVQFPVAC